MYRRFLATAAALLFCFGLLVTRLSQLAVAQPLLEAAQQQSASVLTVAQTRGVIYDHKLRPLTGIEHRYIASVLPCEQSADLLMRETPLWQRGLLQQKLTAMKPFLWEVSGPALYARGVEVFEVPQRTLDAQPAIHLIGQLDAATGRGASGLERAYDDLLRSTGGVAQMRYYTDALQRAAGDRPPQRIDTGYLSGAGLVLTLDREIQAVAERAADAMQRGAVVVMDPYTGDILASVSRPTYNPNDPKAALNNPDAPFFNRALAAFSVGSTFKLLTAATALEADTTAARTYDCQGAIDVLGQVFGCHQRSGHGTIDMPTALRRSCNPYFISLALEVGGANLLYKAQQLGFGAAFEAAPGMFSSAGTLPTQQELQAPAAVGNFGFGQGVLTATPVQIATLVSSIANGGAAVTPRLVAGSTADGRSLAQTTVSYSARPLFRADAAEQVRQMMVSVVTEGSGKTAAPDHGGAGGKTASAQSGQFVDGVEVVHAWFSGFYPAEHPRYTIVVLVEGGDSGAETACPIFKEIADGLWTLENS